MKGKIGVIVEAMKRKISTAVDDLVHNKDLPFSPDVMRYHLSPKLKKCLKVVPNDIIWKEFEITFKGSTKVRFNKLKLGKVGSFAKLRNLFVIHFIRVDDIGDKPLTFTISRRIWENLYKTMWVGLIKICCKWMSKWKGSRHHVHEKLITYKILIFMVRTRECGWSNEY